VYGVFEYACMYVCHYSHGAHSCRSDDQEAELSCVGLCKGGKKVRFMFTQRHSILTYPTLSYSILSHLMQPDERCCAAPKTECCSYLVGGDGAIARTGDSPCTSLYGGDYCECSASYVCVYVWTGSLGTPRRSTACCRWTRTPSSPDPATGSSECCPFTPTR
jgi:hypothetical protein